ncbi:hypothetical protein NM688_g3224 [Phlebia brevispora]|uniref:Uncharacterized protein n=1 Tax=Phlebia brevispora TaxID=194682 RepID=A0ACC1T6I4_9APHY|nr:hypothetical protein NM688_g3224 [Phlebia brevispora]
MTAATSPRIRFLSHSDDEIVTVEFMQAVQLLGRYVGAGPRTVGEIKRAVAARWLESRPPAHREALLPQHRMASEQETYLAVLKASYDYDPQPDAEDELAIKENQLLFLLERTDDDWWRVKIKPDSQDEDAPSGLVPSAYVEPAPHISVVKALYDYEAQQSTELSVHEDDVLYVFGKEEEWLLVQSQKEDKKVGYVPGNYVEETSAEGDSNETSAPSSPPVPDVTTIVVPDSPPKPAYKDPVELVNSSKAKAQATPVETWSISEVDKKGKKKKGTLGVGNGAMFFASEADKTPVQKWQTTDIQSTRLEKSKHVHVEIGGSSPVSLHFHAGSKDVADAILAKIEEARTVSSPGSSPSLGTPTAVATAEPIERPRSAAKSVHFDNSEPEIIPPREVDEDADDDDEEAAGRHGDGGERAVVLYDFTADGDDEMTVHEGETLLVLERDTDEWWKCRNMEGDEGVVPANYLELVEGSGGSSTTSAAPARDYEAEEPATRTKERDSEEQERKEREEAERKEKERKKAEAEQRAKAAAAAAEADRRRREQEREKQREKEKERERAAATAAEERERQRRSSESSRSSRDRRNGDSSGSRSSTDKRPPPSENVRTWHDRTGQFRVDAAFLGFANGKIRLHKVNGVIIEVPQEKMSSEDMRYVEKMMSRQRERESPASPRSRTSDDEPLELRRRSLQPQARPSSDRKKAPTVDWFEFFLNAGCDVDDCTRYAASFERDKIDEAILPDITDY